MSRVWRDLIVSPGKLRVHISALRKALGDGEGGTRFIESVIGQGYCFVAPITRLGHPPQSCAETGPPLSVVLRALP